MADGGTLFLDEISEVPLNQQVKLLRFLDEKSFLRVGSSAPRTVDTRVVAATNKDLGVEAQERRFRKDLFYRLNVVSLGIPSLQGRSEDILDLIQFFLDRIGEKNKLKKQIAREVLDILVRYSFPGNVRELENLVESMMVTSQEETITLRDLPAHILQETDPVRQGALKQTELNLLPQFVQKLEVEQIRRMLEQCGSQREAARRLGVHQSTISRKLQKLQKR
jgi:transcriptional regulator with PAS, ATPase and Fis domain